VFKDAQVENLLPECIFPSWKTALKIEPKKCKNTINCQYLGNGWKYRKNFLKILRYGYSKVFYKEWLLVLNKIERNILCSILNSHFREVKMTFSCKFGAWVSFHTAILQSWKFQQNLGQTVVALPLQVYGKLLRREN